MIVTVGAEYVDCGYHGTVPKTAVQKAPDADVWRRTIVVVNQPDAKSAMVPVVARWEYLDHWKCDGAERGGGPLVRSSRWKIATERNLEIPMTSLGNRFQQQS